MTYALLIINALLTVINAGAYADASNPINLGAALFCGLMTLIQIKLL